MRKNTEIEVVKAEIVNDPQIVYSRPRKQVESAPLNIAGILKLIKMLSLVLFTVGAICTIVFGISKLALGAMLVALFLYFVDQFVE